MMTKWLIRHSRQGLLLLALLGAGCATNPYPAYYGYGPPPGSVTPTIPYTYAPNYGYDYYGGPYVYPSYYYGVGLWPGYGYYGGYPQYQYWRRRPIITGVTPTVPTGPRSGPPSSVQPVRPLPPTPAIRPVVPPQHFERPCVTHRSRLGVTTVCP